jgi:hypothetical protein
VPFFEAGEFVKEYENGRGDKYIEKNRKEKKEQLYEDVENARSANPIATQQQIADVVGISRRYVRDIGAEMAAKSEPKLLKHGGNMAEQPDHSKVDRYGNKADYILARLQRDGQQELADQVKAGTKSARKAAIEAGFKSPESQLTILKRWQK